MTRLALLKFKELRGMGRQLAERGIDWLGNERDIALEVVTYNYETIELYKKLGFEITSPAHNDVAELRSGKVLPEYQMVKRVS